MSHPTSPPSCRSRRARLVVAIRGVIQTSEAKDLPVRAQAAKVFDICQDHQGHRRVRAITCQVDCFTAAHSAISPNAYGENGETRQRPFDFWMQERPSLFIMSSQ